MLAISCRLCLLLGWLLAACSSAPADDGVFNLKTTPNPRATHGGWSCPVLADRFECLNQTVALVSNSMGATSLRCEWSLTRL
ncbi:MAG: hypothetical protein RL385_4945 [Pseudomonadota bacterium]